MNSSASEEVVAQAQAVATSLGSDKLELEDELASVQSETQATGDQLSVAADQVAALMAQLAAARAVVASNRQEAQGFRVTAAGRQVAAALRERMDDGARNSVREWFRKTVLAAKNNTEAQILEDQEDSKQECQKLKHKLQELEDDQIPEEVLERAEKERFRRDKNAAARKEDKSATAAVTQFAASVAVLSLTTQLRMNPVKLQRAGAIVVNLQQEGFSDDDINDVVRALYLDQSDEDMQNAWNVFAGSCKTVSVSEFEESLPLLGESLTDDEVAKLIKTADEACTGELTYEQFVSLMKTINPQETNETKDEGVFGMSLF